jgi:hypothetical protein
VADLHAKIMNIPAVQPSHCKERGERIVYKIGHRDARHAAAELASMAEVEWRDQLAALTADRDRLAARVAELEGELERVRDQFEEYVRRASDGN